MSRSIKFFLLFIWWRINPWFPNCITMCPIWNMAVDSQRYQKIFQTPKGNTAVFHICQSPCELPAWRSSQFPYYILLHFFQRYHIFPKQKINAEQEKRWLYSIWFQDLRNCSMPNRHAHPLVCNCGYLRMKLYYFYFNTCFFSSGFYIARTLIYIKLFGPNSPVSGIVRYFSWPRGSVKKLRHKVKHKELVRHAGCAVQGRGSQWDCVRSTSTNGKHPEFQALTTIILTGACSLESAYVKPKHKTGWQETERDCGNVFS